MEKGMTLLEAWKYLQDRKVDKLYIKVKHEVDYGELEFVETLRIFRDHPMTSWHSGEYPSYFDQDDKDMGCIYDRHIEGLYYVDENCGE